MISSNQCQIEHVNATLELYLRAYCNYQQDNWADLLNCDEFCFNNTQSSTTRHTPYFTNYRFHPVVKSSLRKPLLTGQKLSRTLKASCLYTKYYTMKSDKLIRHKRNMPIITDPRILPETRKPRTAPCLKHPHHAPLAHIALQTTWPFGILQNIGLEDYEFDLPTSMEMYSVFHTSLIKPTASSTPIPNSRNPPPPSTIVADKGEYEVDQILASKILDH